MTLKDIDKIWLTDFEIVQCNGDYKKGLIALVEKIHNAPTIDPEPRWIPIKYRPMDEEEKQFWSEYMDADDEMKMFDRPMPEDG